jgi:aspartate aminotransferase
MPKIANRIDNLTPSPTVSLNAKVMEMKAAGIEILNLTAGQPDMSTPKHICDKAVETIRSGKHGYTPPNGILELRKAISEKYLREYNLRFDENSEITVGVGAKELVYHSLLAIIDEGDEVIIPAPCWTTYIEQVKLAGGKPVLIELENFEELEIRKILEKITPKTKAIILNYPCNPTGAVFSKNNLEELAKIVIQKDLIVISDEMYEKILFEETKFTPFVSLFEKLKERTITINGVSKAYAMTGWRLGFALGDKKFIKAMIKVI